MYCLDKGIELYENVKIDLILRTKITLSGDTFLLTVEEKNYKLRIFFQTDHQVTHPPVGSIVAKKTMKLKICANFGRHVD